MNEILVIKIRKPFDSFIPLLDIWPKIKKITYKDLYKLIMTPVQVLKAKNVKQWTSGDCLYNLRYIHIIELYTLHVFI